MLLLLALITPIHAHSDAELEEWLEDYTTLTVTHPGAVEVYRLILEDMRLRHPCRPVIGTWTEACEVPVPSPAPAGPSMSSAVAAPSVDRGMGTGVEQWRGLVSSYFPADQVERALCIMSHESGGNPEAANSSSTAAGLFQFLRSTWDNMVPLDITGGSYDSGQVFNAEANIRSAAWLMNAAGWSQWSPYNRGLCH